MYIHIQIHIYTYIYIFTYIYIYSMYQLCFFDPKRSFVLFLFLPKFCGQSQKHWGICVNGKVEVTSYSKAAN